MHREPSDFWVFLAWVMAWVGAIAAFISILHYGSVEVPKLYSWESTKYVTNWPLIVGLGVAAVFGFLFAALVSAATTSGQVAIQALKAASEAAETAKLALAAVSPPAAESDQDAAADGSAEQQESATAS